MPRKTKLTHVTATGNVETRTTARDYTHVVEVRYHIYATQTREQVLARFIDNGWDPEQAEARADYAIKVAKERRSRGSVVVSWHGSKALADKAAATRTAQGYVGVQAVAITPEAPSTTVSNTKSNRRVSAPANTKENHMPTKTKTKSARKSASKLTNSNARKEQARKAGKCQLCGTKTKGHSVVIDYDSETVTKSAAGRAKAGHAFYCTDCADKKVKRYEWKLTRRGAAPKRTRKAKAAAKSAAKPAPKKAATKTRSRKATPKGKAATTKAAPKRTRKAKASTAAKPAAKKARKATPKKATTKAAPRRKSAKAAKAETAADPF